MEKKNLGDDMQQHHLVFAVKILETGQCIASSISVKEIAPGTPNSLFFICEKEIPSPTTLPKKKRKIMRQSKDNDEKESAVVLQDKGFEEAKRIVINDGEKSGVKEEKNANGGLSWTYGMSCQACHYFPKTGASMGIGGLQLLVPPEPMKPIERKYSHVFRGFLPSPLSQSLIFGTSYVYLVAIPPNVFPRQMNTTETLLLWPLPMSTWVAALQEWKLPQRKLPPNENNSVPPSSFSENGLLPNTILSDGTPPSVSLLDGPLIDPVGLSDDSLSDDNLSDENLSDDDMSSSANACKLK